MALLREILHSATHLLLPQLCEGCKTALLFQERVLCIGCTAHIPQTGFHHIPDNEAALRIAGRIPYQNATAFAYFTGDGLLQYLLHRLKYSGRRSVGIYLGQQAGYALRSSPWIAGITAVVPVPLHARKEAGRGFNQSALIASGIAEVLGVPLYEHALRRIRHTDSQTKKSREERVANVMGAFTLHPKADVSAHHVLLVDDVLTTGATLEAAAEALLKAPGVKLSVCTIGLATS